MRCVCAGSTALLTSYHGSDRFVFHVFEASRQYHLEFPNSTTGHGPELMAQLRDPAGRRDGARSSGCACSRRRLQKRNGGGARTPASP